MSLQYNVMPLLCNTCCNKIFQYIQEGKRFVFSKEIHFLVILYASDNACKHNNRNICNIAVGSP